MADVDYDAAVAVIGMAGRFSGADSVEELWDNLLAGRPGLRVLSDEELMAQGVSPARLADPDYVRTTGSVRDHDMFDAGMFGFGQREAETMDPQHRLFLENCFEALESAGYPPMAMTEKVGVFAGCGFPDYLWNVAFATITEAGGALMMAVGNERDSLASLASYKMNLRGPSITVQTFCSTSLIAVHLAAQSLLNFECEIALAGGVFVPLPQNQGYLYEEGGILAPDGVVRAFDAGARGSVMGSGTSVVVLKRLSDALDDGDDIAAVVLGSATNNDGSACAGYTAPGVDGQAAVISDAITFAGVKPETIDYVECHGTGTVLGDSIEVAAMERVFPERVDNPVVLGTLKPSIGHLDRAAGTSSMIRAILALRHGIQPGTPNFRNPNPALASARRKFTVLTENRPWPAAAGPRRAGVSAFGLGGSNAHVVLEEPPSRLAPLDRPGPHVLVVSTRTAAAADRAVENLLRHLDRHPEQVVADVAFTLQQSRSYFPVRRAVVCTDAADARQALGNPRRLLSGEPRHRDPLVDVVIPTAPAEDTEWWAALYDAARRISAGTDGTGGLATVAPTSRDAVRAVVEALQVLGVRIGAVSGPEGDHLAAELGIATGRSCPVQVEIAHDGATPAPTWLARTIARLWLDGANVRWAALHPSGTGATGGPRRVPLPTYPFERRRYWVEGVAGMVSPPASTVEGRVDDLDRWTYLPTWQSQPALLADHGDAARAAGSWLVLAADERGEAIAAHLRDVDADVTVARPGAEYAQTGPGEHVVRPGCGEDLTRLLSGAPTLPASVVHAFALGSGDAHELGYRSAVALTSAYSALAPDLDLNLLAVTEGTLSVAGSAPTHADHAALGGLLPVLAQENPGWTCRHVDVVAEAAAVRATAAAAVVAEALAPHRGPIALRGRSRWARAFIHLPLPAPSDGAMTPGSVVLVTGGLGHVGLILARHLAVERGCRVVLTARSAPPPREQWEQGGTGTGRTAGHVRSLLGLERQGGQVMAVAADVADLEGMRAAVTAAEAHFGPVDVVVHAAGVSDASGFGPSHMMSRAGSDQHFAAKQTGFEVLRQIFAGRAVRGITLSSLSAVLGGLALGPYSAANAALDAHVLAARVSDGLRWITVNWDTWGKPSGGNPQEPGTYDMASDEAVQVFERALAAVDSVDHLVISTGALDDRFQQWVIDRGAGPQFSDEDIERHPRPDLSTPFVEPSPGTEATLAAIWSRVLRLETVGADDDFFGLGGNSVLAIEVVARIRKEMKVPVPTAAVLGYPTVRGLAGQIDEVAEADPPVAAA